MKSKIGHIYLYVSDLNKSFKFYKKLLEYLGYEQTVRADWGFAFVSNGTSIWFEKARIGHLDKGFHRKRIGINHICFRLTSKSNVHKFYLEFIKRNKIQTLYDTPKLFPEYDKDYYAVFFEDPDRIKLEVSYYP